MKSMEIGGFLELEELGYHEEYYNGGLRLQSGRACLGYLIQQKKIRKIHLPYYICDAVIQICQKMDCDIDYYPVDENLFPMDHKSNAGDYFYLVNYFGSLSSEQIRAVSNNHTNLIVDNAQAFFNRPLDGMDTIYTCRKFFGVPDGAYLFTDLNDRKNELIPFYTEKIDYLVGRYEQDAEHFFKQYQLHEKVFDTTQICSMSKTSRNLMRNIDYNRCIRRRKENFEYLHEELKAYNQWTLAERVYAEGAFSYPFYAIDGIKLRKYLIMNKIYVPLLWQNVLENRPSDCREYKLAENLLALPCDQRYSKKDMKKIINCIQDYYKKNRNGVKI